MTPKNDLHDSAIADFSLITQLLTTMEEIDSLNFFPLGRMLFMVFQKDLELSILSSITFLL